MDNPYMFRIIGGIFIIVGLVIRYAIGRRKFNRRTMTGIEGFKSYRRAVTITFAERLARFLANILIIIGIFAILSTMINMRSLYSH